MRLPPDIGIPTVAWEELPLGAALERVAALGELAEILSWGGHTLLDPGNRRAALDSGLRLTVHGPYEDLEPGSPDESLRRHAVDEHHRHLEAAAEVGALRYVVHPDYTEVPAARDPAVLAALSRTLAELSEFQKELGVAVAIENLDGAGHSHFTAPGELDLGDLGFALDTGHAAISGTLDDFLRAPQARLTHVHLNDNRGPLDADDPHLALGRGIVDAAAVLETARHAGATVILELLSEAEVHESIVYLRRKGLVAAG